MKFTRIELENVFAYAGETVLDVGCTSDERNIVLVWGRNGMGKTSLLNAVKLLFLGAENRSLRSIGFPSRVLGPRQFVLGDGASWSGIINRRAYHQDEDTVARVRVVWEADGGVIAAERRWRRHGGGYRESLEVFDGESRLTDTAAEERLQDFLPSDFVEFFFFDGEEIKALAEMAEGRKAVDFDKVLRTSFISELASEVSRMVRERRRAVLEQSVREKIATVEGEIVKAETTTAAAEEAIATYEEELVDCRREQSQLITRRENLRTGASSAEREELELKVGELQERLGQLMEEVCRTVPSVAPMAANPSLTTAAIGELDKRLNRGGAAQESIIRQVQRALPTWLAEGPPELTERTRTMLAGKLKVKLEDLVQRAPSAGLFARLDSERAERVRDLLLRFASSDQRRAQSQLLANTHRTLVDLQRSNEALIELEVGSEATVLEYRRITKTLEGVENRIEKVNQDIGQQKRKLLDAQATLSKSKEELGQLEKTAAQASADSQDVKYIGRVARSLNDLREDMRLELREEVMELINEKFRVLVHDHELIQKIELDETYTLIFRDRRGRPIGRSSLSSGIKQLAATALLWAMKEVAGYEVPVIIDTPLGRIDKENQEHMLLNYYPKLAEQVIVLPTNAEIDERKYEMVRSRIAKEYLIRNESGDGASAMVGSLMGRGV